MNPHVTYNSTPAASDHSPLFLFDRVLVRNRSDQPWMPRIFAGLHTETAENGREVCEVSHFQTTDGNYYLQCLPYEGNEHLIGTTDKPERCNPDKNTLFGIKLKPGYVLEFEDDETGILFPTANGFAVSYAKGYWQFLKGIKKDSIVRIMGITQTDYLRSGELLWKRPQKQAITKAEIAEKLGMKAKDFEIIEEDNEENE